MKGCCNKDAPPHLLNPLHVPHTAASSPNQRGRKENQPEEMLKTVRLKRLLTWSDFPTSSSCQLQDWNSLQLKEWPQENPPPELPAPLLMRRMRKQLTGSFPEVKYSQMEKKQRCSLLVTQELSQHFLFYVQQPDTCACLTAETFAP